MLKVSSWFRIPKTKSSSKKGSTYPFSTMKIGQSFYSKKVQAARAAVYRFQKNKRKKFVMKKQGKGIRVWRAK